MEQGSKTSQRVTVLGPNHLPNKLADKGTFHVHAAGCADIKRRYPADIARDGWTFEALSILDVVFSGYDPSNFDYDPNDPAEVAPYESDFHFAPCVKLPHEHDAQWKFADDSDGEDEALVTLMGKIETNLAISAKDGFAAVLLSTDELTSILSALHTERKG